MPVTESESKLLDDVSTETEWELLEKFSHLNRVFGNPEEIEAGEWIANKLRSFGITVNVYDPELYISVPKRAEFEIVDPIRYYSKHADVASNPKTSAFSKSGTYEGDVVYVPGKRGKSLTSFFDFQLETDADLRGKALLTDGILFASVAYNAEQRGASAVISHMPGKWTHEGILTPIWGTPTPDTMNLMPKVQGISICKEDGDVLKTHLKNAPVKVRITTESEVSWRRCLIPVAEIRPPNYEGEDFVLFNGHYDSWHVGIGDNATGNAVLLETARLLQKNREKLGRAVRIAWWPGHSTGRYAGSTWYSDNFAMELDRGCIVNMNCDSPGCKDATNYDMSTWMDELEDFGRTTIKDAIGKDAAGIRPVRAGDYSFNGVGIPSFFGLTSYIPKETMEARGWYNVGGCGGNPGWHTEHDDMTIADRGVMEADTKVYALAAFRLASAPLYPLNFRRTVSKSIEFIGEYEKATSGEFDFSPLMHELHGLQDDVQLLYQFIEGNKLNESQTRIANESFKSFARLIIPVFYTRSGRFNHDLALEVPPYPELSGARTLHQLKNDKDSFRFHKTQLLRSRNKVHSIVRDARREVQHAVRDMQATH